MRQYLQKFYIKCAMAMLFSVFLFVFFSKTAMAETASGTCGVNLNWSLDAGTLTISGSGDMEDFKEPEMAPWFAYRSEILRVNLPEELTSISSLAFYGCDNLTAVVIPDKVEYIGKYAFANCTDLQILELGEGVQVIDEGAFSECLNIISLRFPDSLQNIGIKAFYRCEALTMLMIPYNVQYVGTSAFAYCTNLVLAEIEASLEALPEWIFYGCSKLTTVILGEDVSDISDFAFRGCEQLYTVYYDGEAKTKQEIQEIISGDLPEFGVSGAVINGKPNGGSTSETITNNGDGTVTQQNTTVAQGINSSITTSVQSNRLEEAAFGDDHKANITVTVDGEDGWSEAQNAVQEALKDLNNQYATKVEGGIGEVDITVYVKETDIIAPEFIQTLMGRDVKLTFLTSNGSTWQLKCANMYSAQEEGKYNLIYTVTVGTEEYCKKLEVDKVFALNFANLAEINAEVLIRIPKEYALQNATLYQENGKKLEKLSTVVVDKAGYAHFYLASVSNEVQYYIALNTPAIETLGNDVIIPESLYDEYGGLVDEYGTKYVVTGRKSSWDMEIGQVTWILVGVLTATVVAVGVIMYILNKRSQILSSDQEWNRK